MLSDGLTALQADGKAREEVEVLDVAQMLLASVKRGATPDTETGDAEADDEQYPATVAHDGTVDPEDAASAKAADKGAKSPEREPDKELDEPSAWEPEADQTAPQHAGDTEPGLTPEQSSLGKEPGEGASTAGQTVRDGVKLWEREEEELTPEAREELKAELKDELRSELLAELRGEAAGGASNAAPAAPATETKPEPEPEPAAKAEPEPAAEPDPEPEPEPEPEPAAKAEPEPAAEPEPEPEPDPEPEPEAKTEPAAEPKKDEGGDPPMLIGSL
jgi:hypothetical protein